MMSHRRFFLVFLIIVLLSSCAPAVLSTPVPGKTATADLNGIKTYLLAKSADLNTSAVALQSASNNYYALAEAAGFNYADMWVNNPEEARVALANARSAWLSASPQYEQMEGIVAGVPSLSKYDVILDAGASGTDDPENAAPYDLILPDGRTLERPGNVFGVLESALWGTEPAYKAFAADLDGSGELDFGESLPDAHVLKAAADVLVSYVAELESTATAWQPSVSDAFTALVIMVPTMNEYFNSWKASRFVSGTASTQRDFVAISRLADIQDILASLQVVYQGIRPMAEAISIEQAASIEQSLSDLKSFVANVHIQEKNGKQFSPEEADLLGAEAQNRATALAGQIAQVAAQLNISIAE